MMLSINNVRTEYMKNPIGIDVQQPRISWQLESDMRNVMQEAYHIQISDDSKFKRLLWDSDTVFSDQSLHVKIGNIKMESCKRYYYRVQAWDQDNNTTGWSEPCFWETGFIHSNEWNAKWISAPKDISLDCETQSVLFRKSFDTDKKVMSARIYVTSLGLYEVHINGQRVGKDYFTPGWTNYKSRLQYQTYDVTSHIQSNENVIGATLGNGWYMGQLAWEGQDHIYGDQLSLLLELHVWHEDGSKSVIKTDEEWKVSKGPILISEIYHGESYDARLEKQGWMKPDFQDQEWLKAKVLDHPNHILIAQENEPVRKIEEIKPVDLIETPNGEKVLDMGQNMVGWIRFSIKGESGVDVILKHAEVLDRDGNFYTENLRGAKQTNRYILSGGKTETFEPHFSFQGFRYVQLIGFPEPIDIENFTGIVLHSDMERTGYFECSDPRINQLQHNIIWGQKGNFLDVPTDCPQRDERLGWTGDAQMFISTAAYLRNVAPFFTKWLRDLKSDQLDDGGVPFVIPQILQSWKHSSSAWGDAAVICPWTLYQNYGDIHILEEQYESMKAWVEYIRGQGDQEYLWNTGFHFGDWLALDSEEDSYIGATESDFIATAFYAYSVSILKKTAKVLNKTEDTVEYAQLYSEIIKAFQDEFVTLGGRLAVRTQTAQILALKFGLLDGVARQRAISRLVELLNESNDHLKTGFVGTPYLNLVLSQVGQDEKAFNLLFQTDYPSWLYQVERGATTIWEHWDGIKEDESFWSDDMNSFNHYAYGSIGDWLYRCVAGINTDEEQTGFKHVLIHPHLDQRLEWAEGKLESMYGLIRSSWSRNDDGSLDMKLSLPPNTTASVFLPQAKEETLQEGGRVVKHHMSGLHTLREGGAGMTLVLGSGEYQFHYKVEQLKKAFY